MKKANIFVIIVLILGIGLIAAGMFVKVDKKGEEKDPLENKEGYIYGDKYIDDYKEIGSKALTEDQIFDKIKYTQNHLSTTSDEFATFTSVIYNQTGENIKLQKLEIDFYDAEKKLIATMPSEIENLAPDASTMIFGIVEKNLTKADSFIVRQVQ